MDYEKLADLINELGELGRNGREEFNTYLTSSCRDGDTYMEEGFLQLHDVYNDTYGTEPENG